MSANTSWTESAGIEHLDRDFEFLSLNNGAGTQKNHNQTGSENVQYNAHTQIFHKINNEQEKRIEACRDALLDILPEDQRAALTSAKGDRVDGTCGWIKQDDEYRSLLRGDTRLLWIHGGPGKGKTMLSIFLTEDLEETQEVVYFFCQADDEKHRSAIYVLRSLIWQMSQDRPTIAAQLVTHLYPPKQRQATLASREALWRIFSTIANDVELGSTVCILDGLDECDEDTQRWLVAKLVKFCNPPGRVNSESLMKFIAVSRPTVTALRKCRQINFDPDNDENINRDIEAFVSTRVQELSDSLNNLSESSLEDFKSGMKTELLNRAEGTFLWVGFATIELLRKTTWTEMRLAVQRLPKGLPALYDRMLLQIDQHHRPTSSKIMHWIANAARPLHIDELAMIIGCKQFGPITSEQSILDQITICGSFIKVSAGVLSLIHESARQYLSSEWGRESVAPAEFRLKVSSVHLKIVAFCLAYILQHYKTHESDKYCDLACDAKVNRGYDHQLDHNVYGSSTMSESRIDHGTTLLGYAILYWPQHARQTGDNHEQLMACSPLFFSTSSPPRTRWWNTFPRSRALGTYNLRGSSALQIACYMGVTSWAVALLKSRRRTTSSQGLEVAAVSARELPLFYAVVGGHTAMIHALIQAGVSINASDLHGRTALYVSVALGSERTEITQLLLEYGASVDIQDRKGHAILGVAAERGDVEIMRLLLERTVNINPKCPLTYDYTPLHYASWAGHGAVVQCLLERGAEVDAKATCQTTPLHAAVKSGKSTAVRWLLQAGAMVNARRDSKETPLHLAVQQVIESRCHCVGLCTPLLHPPDLASHREVFALLLEAGADVDAVSEAGETPLDLAFMSQNFAAARELILGGSKIISKHRYDGLMPLHYACIEGDRELVKSLLNQGVDVHLTDHGGRTPLHYAAEHNLESLQLLIDHGAEVDAKDMSGNTPLCYTIPKCGTVARFLRGRGAKG